MIDLRKKFTKWYYRKGYRMLWVPCPYGDGTNEMIFTCPWWAKFLTYFFFSPSVYYAEDLAQLEDIFERRVNELKGDSHDQSGLENTQETP